MSTRDETVDDRTDLHRRHRDSVAGGARRLTVLQTLPALDAGGVERGTLEVARALVEAGHRSLVLAAGGRLVSSLIAQGSEHIDLPVGSKQPLTLALVPRIRRLLRDEGVDILHARSRLPAWIAWLAWRGLPVATRPRFVTTVHGLYSVGRYSAIMTRGERVIAVSDTVREYVRTHYPATPEDRLTVIPRGVSRHEYPLGYRAPEAWCSEWRDRYPGLEHRIVLALPGRITRLKGHGAFLDLMERLLGAGLAVHGLVVGGEDPRRQRYAESVRCQARTRNLPVTFTGHRADLREVYTRCDLVLSLSARPESFGRTVLEALSLGVPVVGYDHGGVGEILKTVYPAGLVPKGDVGAVAERVKALIASPVPVPEDHPYSLEKMLRDTLAVYEALARGPVAAGAG